MNLGVVYFIRGGPFIKIGTTVNLQSRLASLQTSTPEDLRLLGSMPGDASVERGIHQRLSIYRKRGEWFLDCTKVREVIVELCGRDVFELVDTPPQPAPLCSITTKLIEMLADAKSRYRKFSNYCLEGCESDKDSKLWRLHVAQRHTVGAVLASAGRAIQEHINAFQLSGESDIDAVGRCVASVELCECQVELILGDAAAWFLDEWKAEPRSNPLFETAGGKIRWQTRDEAEAAGWIAPPNSFQAQIAPWLLLQAENSASDFQSVFLQQQQSACA